MNKKLEVIHQELATLKAEAERLRQRAVELEAANSWLERERDEAQDVARQWKLNAQICYETCDELRRRIAALEAPTPELWSGGGS